MMQDLITPLPVPWILLVQHETTCKPSMGPCDEPQTLQSLLLENGRIQHSHTIGDSKALSVKDSSRHPLPVLDKRLASAEYITMRAADSTIALYSMQQHLMYMCLTHCPSVFQGYEQKGMDNKSEFGNGEMKLNPCALSPSLL